MNRPTQYIINGEAHGPLDSEQLLRMAKLHLQRDGELTIERKEKRTHAELIDSIRELSWEAQAALAGIVAVTNQIDGYLTGETFDNDFSLAHISWLQIYAQEKVKALSGTIDEAMSIENAAAGADREARRTHLDGKPVDGNEGGT